MAKSFEVTVDDWVRKSSARLEAVAKTAIHAVAEDIIKTTPVDTGFLRASFNITKNTLRPVRAGARPSSGQTFQEQPFALTINGVKIGDTVYGNFVADYAIHVEMGTNGRAGRRMVGKAVQKWPQRVNDAVRMAKARVNR